MSTVIKYHGSKHYLAPKLWKLVEPIIGSITHCVEPYCGSCSFTLEGLRRGYNLSFAVNDISGDLTNFWRVLQGEDSFGRFKRLCEATPFSEEEWREAGITPSATACVPSYILRAWKFFIRCRQSLAGRMDCFAPLSRNRTRRGMNEQASAWITAVDGLPEVHRLLRQVAILGPKPATDVIRQQDGPKTMHYADPPYLHEARTSKKVYDHEMTRTDHIALLAHIKHAKGKMMLSGYPNELYDGELKDWNVVDFDLPNNAAGGEQKRRMTERIWKNF